MARDPAFGRNLSDNQKKLKEHFDREFEKTRKQPTVVPTDPVSKGPRPWIQHLKEGAATEPARSQDGTEEPGSGSKDRDAAELNNHHRDSEILRSHDTSEHNEPGALELVEGLHQPLEGDMTRVQPSQRLSLPHHARALHQIAFRTGSSSPDQALHRRDSLLKDTLSSSMAKPKESRFGEPERV